MNWIDYVRSTAGSDKNAAIAYKSGVTEATVSRWSKSAPKPDSVAAFARAYGRPVLEAFIAAGYLTPEEANEQPAARPSLADLPNDELIAEIARRLKAEDHDHDTAPPVSSRPSPAPEAPPQKMRPLPVDYAADQGPSAGEEGWAQAQELGEESQDDSPEQR